MTVTAITGSAAGMAPVLQLVPRCEADPYCRERSAVVVRDRTDDRCPCCEQHAAELLGNIIDAKLAKVWDWDAARRLLALPWNRRGVS